jgi:hypothetical protein
MSMMVVYEFDTPGVAARRCAHLSAMESGQWRLSKIIAIRIAMISTQPLTLP